MLSILDKIANVKGYNGPRQSGCTWFKANQYKVILIFTDHEHSLNSDEYENDDMEST